MNYPESYCDPSVKRLNMFFDMLVISREMAMKPSFVEDGTVRGYLNGHRCPMTAWIFESNPAKCNIENYHLEELPVFLFHVTTYYWRKECDFSKDDYQSFLILTSEVLDKLTTHSAVDTEGACYNCLSLLQYVLEGFSPSFISKQTDSITTLKNILTKIFRFKTTQRPVSFFKEAIKCSAWSLEYLMKMHEQVLECSGNLQTQHKILSDKLLNSDAALNEPIIRYTLHPRFAFCDLDIVQVFLPISMSLQTEEIVKSIADCRTVTLHLPSIKHSSGYEIPQAKDLANLKKYVSSPLFRNHR